MRYYSPLIAKSHLGAVLRRREFFFAALLLLLMAVRLVHGLNAESLWGDEGWSVYVTDGSTPRSVVLAIAEDRHPPLYFLMLYLWRHTAGEDEIPLRLLAVFPTLIGGALLYRLGRRLFGAAAGLCALLILTLLDKQVVFSQEVRHYSWLMLWTVASTYTLVRWMRVGVDQPIHTHQRKCKSFFRPHPRPLPASREGMPWRNASLVYGEGMPWRNFPLLVYGEGDRGWGGKYVLTLTAGLYTHSFMLIVLLTQVIYALVALRPFKKVWRLLGLWALAGMAFAPWGVVFVYQYILHGGLKHDFPLTRRVLEMLTLEFLGKPVALFAGLLLLGALSPILRVGGWREARPQKNTALLPVLELLIPLAIIVGLPALNEDFKLLTDRNLVIIIPSLALLIGLGITVFEGFPRAVLIVFLLVNGVFTRDVILNNPPMRPISRYIAAHQVDNQPVMMEVGGADASLAYHLRQEVSAEVRLISALGLRENYRNKGIEPLTVLRFEKLNGVEGLWYVYWNNDPEFLNALSAWGYVRSATAQDTHLGKPIYIYRYDSAAILERSAALFGEQIRLHQAVFPAEIARGEALRAALWWSADLPLPADYTMSVFVLDGAGRLVAQHDGYPSDGQMPTSSWNVGTLIFDLHRLPTNLAAGDYQVGVKVYNGVNGTPLLTQEGKEYFHAGRLKIIQE